MDDERIGGRPVFYVKYLRNRFGVQRVGREAVNRLSRQGHDFSGCQKGSDGIEIGIIWREESHTNKNTKQPYVPLGMDESRFPGRKAAIAGGGLTLRALSGCCDRV